MARGRTQLALGENAVIVASIKHYWRLAATGGCFVLFSLGGLVLWTTVFPILRVLPSRRRERTRWVIHKSFAAFLGLMEITGIMRLDVEGGERLRNLKGALVLANHPTLIDFVALVSLMPSASCVVKQALWKSPFLGGVVRAAGYVSNSDPDRLIHDCADELKAGWPVIIFPEGTRTQPGESLSFQRGAAYVALRSGLPTVPVLIDCNPMTLTKRDKWYQIPPRRFHLRIRVLDPIDVERWSEPEDAQTIAARKLTRAFEGFFIQELSRWTC
jgi:1-acyl-sn-glycerol-3-phosphate acyltransferase